MTRFPITNYYHLHFSTTPNNQLVPTVTHTYFSTKFRNIFNFIETFTHDQPDTCDTIIQNSTNYVATLPTGNIGYIEVPITNEKPKHYQFHDLNSLVHNFAQTFHSEITEPIVPTNYAPHYIEDTSHHPQFSLNQIYMTYSSRTSKIPNSLYNVQPSSHTTKPRIFSSFPYTKENLKSNNKFKFQFSDLTNRQ